MIPSRNYIVRDSSGHPAEKMKVIAEAGQTLGIKWSHNFIGNRFDGATTVDDLI